MNTKNILVTGGFGILGRSLIKQLLNNKKNKVFLLDRSSNSKKILTDYLKNIFIKQCVTLIKKHYKDVLTMFRQPV